MPVLSRYVRPEDWLRHVLAPEGLPSVPQRIAFPFAGLDGPARACQEMKLQYIADHVFEILPWLEKAVKHLYVDKENFHPDAFHFGKVDGDVTRVDPDVLRAVEGLIAGFPCPPRSVLGRRKSLSDPRAQCAVARKIIKHQSGTFFVSV